jgi:hypothetical protein
VTVRAEPQEDAAKEVTMAFWSLSKPTRAQTAPDPVATMDADTLKSELGHAYERGRSHERSRRAGRGLITSFLVVLSAAGVLFLALAAHEGSFAGAGADIDRTLAQAASQVRL